MRDGHAEVITRDIGGDGQPPIVVDCGSALFGNHGGRFRQCTLGHVHCTICYRKARKHRVGWTCGICPGKPMFDWAFLQAFQDDLMSLSTYESQMKSI